LMAHMVARSALMVAVAIALIAATGYWFSRIPTGFLPIEDQGYMIAIVQLPDGASLERTQKTLDKVFEIARKTPGVARVVNIAGVSALDNSATLSSARGRLHHPQGLERARRRRRPHVALQQAQRRSRRDSGG